MRLAEDISAIFDFIVINDEAHNDEQVKKIAVTPKDVQGIARGKQRLGLIKYEVDELRRALEGKSAVLVLGDLLEVVDNKVTLFYRENGGIIQGNTAILYSEASGRQRFRTARRILFASDLHATLNAALRFRLAFPNVPLVVIGDPSDRGP